MKIHTYINFPGNCEQALHFYQEHLGGTITRLMHFEEMPEPKNIPPGLEGKVLHARITIGDTELFASDGPPGKVEPMRSAYITMHVNSSEEAEWFNGLLGDQGEVFMPMQDTFFAHRFSMLRDRFGVNWMIIHERARE